jgi:Lon protease-like protein
MAETIPLFPLNLVLFPGARLALRIFESRYIDMVRDCMRADTGFGVVWRLDGDQESAGGHARVGTEARIFDFSTLKVGLLGIECRGTRRFLVRSTRCRDNGLLIGEVDWVHDQPSGPIPTRHAALQSLMREILAQKGLAGQVEADTEDAASLGFGLASVLPIDQPRAQGLLESTEPEQRLDALMGMIEGMSEADSSGTA